MAALHALSPLNNDGKEKLPSSSIFCADIETFAKKNTNMIQQRVKFSKCTNAEKTIFAKGIDQTTKIYTE